MLNFWALHFKADRKTLSTKRVVFIASKSSLNTWRQSLSVRECPTSVVIIPELALTSYTINQWLITPHVHHVDSSCDADGWTENSSSCLRLMLKNIIIMNILSNKIWKIPINPILLYLRIIQNGRPMVWSKLKNWCTNAMFTGKSIGMIVSLLWKHLRSS